VLGDYRQPDVYAVWRDCLARYRYPVALQEYRFRQQHPEWFARCLNTGDLAETAAFEEYFRQHAPIALEPWYEVVFWKLASQKQIRNGTTRNIAESLASRTTAEKLWEACHQYTQCLHAGAAREKFRTFLDLFDLKTDSVAVVATFPAFMDPERFCMVDTRIAKWVGHEMEVHNRADPTVPLLRPPFLDSSATVLKMKDFDFLQSWVQWCRYAAAKLTAKSDGFQWRTRDVEMAVFTAWGDRKARVHPVIALPPIL
jgi:hypothetical protein